MWDLMSELWSTSSVQSKANYLGLWGLTPAPVYVRYRHWLRGCIVSIHTWPYAQPTTWHVSLFVSHYHGSSSSWRQRLVRIRQGIPQTAVHIHWPPLEFPSSKPSSSHYHWSASTRWRILLHWGFDYQSSNCALSNSVQVLCIQFLMGSFDIYRI